jgi:acyl carrier protein
MTTELTTEQRLENIFLTLDSLDRFEVYMMLEELRDENIHNEKLAEYGLDRELLLEIGVEKIIAEMDTQWNATIL